MRLTLALILVLLGLVTALENDDREYLLRQKFIYEILYRVDGPLEFEEWIQHGKTLNVDHSLYSEYDHWMEQFQESYQRGTLLPKGEFFGELVHSHMVQAKGLFHFFYNVKDWKTFQQNACWARINVNEGMFVYALNLAVLHRYVWEVDTPAIYEIFPQHFFNSKFIHQSKRFNYDAWQKWSTYEQEIQNSNYTQQLDKSQWWKWMGLKQRWYSAEEIVGQINYIREELKNTTDVKGNKKFFMPVGYTRDIKVWNMDSKLSYFTEDVIWSNSWYRLNLETSVLLPFENEESASQTWINEVQRYLARYNLERLSNGIDEIEDLVSNSKFRTGYNPQMTSWNGEVFLQRTNNFDWKEISNSQIMQKMAAISDNFLRTLQTNSTRNASEGIIDMRSSKGYNYFTKLLQGDTVLKGDFSESFLPVVMMCNGQMNYDEFHDVSPHVLLNFETMLRDPLAYEIFKTNFLGYLRQYQQILAPYTREQLLVEGVQIVDAQFGELVTKFEYADFDVSNLLNENMNFVDGQYQWKHTLLARQMRLANAHFECNITVDSAVEQFATVRIFIGPKYDKYGRVLSLNDNRLNFMELDKVSWNLQKGKNFKTVKFGNDDGYISVELTYTEKYYDLLDRLENNYLSMLLTRPRRDRWTLPKGTPEGFPVQMFFIIENDWHEGIFPFDREIDESKFFVPNMFFKDVKIYHEDILEKYYNGYSNYGHFHYESKKRV